ncbi:MAG: TonB-dependent receptor [Betaproteobacteria bacterium]|nr:TonB-dependent receptor [Betaproteobacteria bacterium]
MSVLACAIQSAYAAEDATDLGTVGTQASVGSSTASRQGTAAAVAPTRSSLSVTQPQSIISRDFIENSTSPVADFSAVAAIAPSVTGGISPNGPGLAETKNSLRGFKDGEYNVTWDGIPFGDTNGSTHHSTSYFPASVIGSVVVERGPGKASDIGQATFGGSINLFSRQLPSEQNIEAFGAGGSWNTWLYGLRYDSGVLANAGDAKIGLSAQRQTSDGYRTFSSIQGDNVSLKVEKPLGQSTLLTANFNYNRNYYYQPDKDNGLTMAQAAAYGKDYVLSDDPAKANFFGYNRVDKSTGMHYIRLQSDLGDGWGIDNQVYNYYYTNDTLASDSGNVPGVGLGNVKGPTGNTIANQMPGYIKLNKYDNWGNTFRATKQFGGSLARFGLWLEKSDTHRAQSDVNLLDMTPNYKEAAVPGVHAGPNNVKFDQHSQWFVTQPFAEFEWAVTPELTLTPGVKYNSTRLSVDAEVNQTARIPQNFSKTFHAALPFLTANYKFDPTWSAYAQYAKGMLAPDVSLFQSTNATASNVSPQRSTNYQLGFVHKSDKLVVDANVYWIDFTNKFAIMPGTDSQPIYYNQGGVKYKGIEGQITYVVGGGFSAYANGSLNHATSNDTGLTIAGVSNMTAALGLLFNSGSWNSSFIYKRMGPMYALDGSAYKMNAVTQADFNIGYTIANPGLSAKALRVQLGVFNVFNKKDPIAVKPVNSTPGSAAYGQPDAGDTFLFQAPRSAMLSLTADF